MNKHVFVALALPPELPPALREMLRKLKASAGKQELRFHWTEPGSHHLTLHFVGETGRWEEVNAAAGEVAAGFAPLELELSGAGAFPEEHAARAVWAGVRSKVGLRELQESLEAKLTALGFPPDPRGFTPHVTLARLKNKQSLKDLISPFVRRDLGGLRATRLVVCESIPGGPFPRYEVLGSHELGAKAA